METRFDYYELEAYLGEFVDEYDIDAIIDEVTYMDYTTCTRYWKDLDGAEFWEACQRHQVA